MAHLAVSTIISDCNGKQKTSKNSLTGPIFIFRNDYISPTRFKSSTILIPHSIINFIFLRLAEQYTEHQSTKRLQRIFILFAVYSTTPKNAPILECTDTPKPTDIKS